MTDRNRLYGRSLGRKSLWVLTGLFAVAIVWLGLFYNGPVPRVPMSSQWNDKALHVLVFALAAFILETPGRAAQSLAVLVGVAMAVELLQFLTPDREPGLADFAAGVIGVGLGWLMGGTCRIAVVRLFGAGRSVGS